MIKLEVTPDVQGGIKGSNVDLKMEGSRLEIANEVISLLKSLWDALDPIEQTLVELGLDTD